MASNDDSNIVQQVDNRLDDLFGDEGTQDPGDAPLSTDMPLAAVDGSGEAAENPAAGHSSPRVSPLPEKNEAPPPEIDAEEIEHSPIKELKSIILSLFVVFTTLSSFSQVPEENEALPGERRETFRAA